MTKEFLREFISQHKLAVMSSVASGNMPQAALVGIAVTPDLELIFDTVITSRKYQNLLLNPKIAFVIGWDDERTIQYEGNAEIVQGKKLEEMKKIYFSVFPDGTEREKWPNIIYFCVRPKWIRFSDFSSAVPQIEEMHF
jgi:general stress protein 26